MSKATWTESRTGALLDNLAAANNEELRAIVAGIASLLVIRGIVSDDDMANTINISLDEMTATA